MNVGSIVVHNEAKIEGKMPITEVITSRARLEAVLAQAGNPSFGWNIYSGALIVFKMTIVCVEIRFIDPFTCGALHEEATKIFEKRGKNYNRTKRMRCVAMHRRFLEEMTP